jgi:hypothetical protein
MVQTDSELQNFGFDSYDGITETVPKPMKGAKGKQTMGFLKGFN